MVKKLIKYDFIGFGRVMLPTNLVLIGLALLNRFIQLFESDASAYSITFVSSCVVLGIGIVVSIVLTFITCITRFYKTLFTSEGYLSFTLPVSVNQHIFSKIVVSLIFFAINFVSVILAGVTATFGDVLVELVKAGLYEYSMLSKELKYNLPIYIVEAFIILVLQIVVSLLLIYACISIGQLARKNRVASAVGVYFGYYFLTQIIATIFIIIVVVFGDVLHLEELMIIIFDNPIVGVHIVMCTYIVLSCVMGFVYYIISNKILKNRLNLE